MIQFVVEDVRRTAKEIPIIQALVSLAASNTRNSGRVICWGNVPDPDLGGGPMRGRRPHTIAIAPGDEPILRQIARSQSLPWYQVRRARTVLAIAAGERTRVVADWMQCDVDTVRRTCRRYEQSGLPGLLSHPERPGHPLGISPPCSGRK